VRCGHIFSCCRTPCAFQRYQRHLKPLHQSNTAHSLSWPRGTHKPCWGCRTGLGKYPGHLPNLVLLLKDRSSQAAKPLACSLAVRQTRHEGERDGAQLLLEVVLVFLTSEMECASESWQELTDDLLEAGCYQ